MATCYSGNIKNINNNHLISEEMQPKIILVHILNQFLFKSKFTGLIDKFRTNSLISKQFLRFDI